MASRTADELRSMGQMDPRLVEVSKPSQASALTPRRNHNLTIPRCWRAIHCRNLPLDQTSLPSVSIGLPCCARSTISGTSQALSRR